MKTKLLFTIPAVAFTTFFFSCSEVTKTDTTRTGDSKIVVEATNYPLYYFASRIAGGAIQLNFLPGEKDGDPAFWEPSDSDIAQLQKASLILMNGATYEKWAASASLPETALVDTSRNFSGEFLSSDELVTHSHGPGGEHSHGGTAFTTWLDFNQAIWQAEEIRDALIRVAPVHEDAFNQNFESLANDLDALHQRFKAIGKSLNGIPLVASHPIYQYFSRRYELDIEAVHWEPEPEPDEAKMKALNIVLEKQPAKWMIWEGEPIQAAVDKLTAIGIKSLVIDPCGNRPTQGDWLTVMQKNAENLGRLAP